jgi:hypothetical protein
MVAASKTRVAAPRGHVQVRSTVSIRVPVEYEFARLLIVASVSLAISLVAGVLYVAL